MLHPVNPVLVAQWASDLRSVVKSLVTDAAAVKIETTEEDEQAVFTIYAAKQDYGRVIGRGHTGLQALITLTRAWAGRHGGQAHVKVADPGPSTLAHHALGR